MFTEADRIRAIELYFKYGRKISAVIRELGYPTERNLRRFLARDFTAVLPNQKWLTDITEFQLPAGKVWLSPVVDCFAGKVVSWSVVTRPDAELANSMLESAIGTLKS